MHASTRQALWQISRRKVQTPTSKSRLQYRTFHRSAAKESDGKPPSGSDESQAAQDETDPKERKESGRSRSERGNDLDSAEPSLQHVEALPNKSGNHLPASQLPDLANSESSNHAEKAESARVRVQELQLRGLRIEKALLSNARSLGDEDLRRRRRDNIKRAELNNLEKVRKSEDEDLRRRIRDHTKRAEMDHLAKVRKSEYELARSKASQTMEKLSKEAEGLMNALSSIAGPDNAKRKGRRRTLMGRARSKTTDGLGTSDVNLPSWLFERNMTFVEDRNSVTQEGKDHAQEADASIDLFEKDPTFQLDFLSGSGNFPGEKSVHINSAVYMEIYTSIAASLGLAKGNSNSPIQQSIPQKTSLGLCCPIDGGAPLLNAVLESVASKLGADILRLNAQDFAELALHNTKDLQVSPELQKVADLGFEMHKIANGEESGENGENGDDDEVPIFVGETLKNSAKALRAKFMAVGEPTGTKQGQSEESMALQNFLSGIIDGVYAHKRVDGVATTCMRVAAEETTPASHDEIGPASGVASEPTRSSPTQPESNNTPQEPESITQAEIPINTEDADTSTASEEGQNASPKRKLIICLEDFLPAVSSSAEIAKTLLQSLEGTVQWQRTFYNQEIVIVATKSSSHITAKSLDIRFGSDNAANGIFFRTIMVSLVDTKSTTDTNTMPDTLVPAYTASAPSVWDHLAGDRTRNINLRNLEHMLKYFTTSQSTPQDSLTLSEELIQRFHLREDVLSRAKVSRIMTISRGLDEINSQSGHLKDYIPRAMSIIEKSDAHFDSMTRSQTSTSTRLKPSLRHKTTKARMEALKSKCNKYEQQLLSGVVHPENIKIGFDDVHVSPDTIDALKTMTSLSFTRPDAFQYGILKSDSLPGLLMYGPPGTGKTMLAKAVASSTSTTVLTISGSEIRQMYVGESEKIIKAVFTLAQKLTPCIVFIDEADSLLGTRAVSETGNTTRRDTINQFLLEWDGLNESSVFLMVATNRPFDLDDAVLRRLPRRLLVDLPTKDDRAAILGLHLRGEILDPTVDIAILATSTPFYSGSDLKNVVVSTALAAVKEENEIATQAITGGDAGYKYPDRRILTQRHFEKALEEIAASVGEDMVSLSAMRKWDERYGDRKGRRKRSGWGFGREKGGVEEGDVRVRN